MTATSSAAQLLSNDTADAALVTGAINATDGNLVTGLDAHKPHACVVYLNQTHAAAQVATIAGQRGYADKVINFSAAAIKVVAVQSHKYVDDDGVMHIQFDASSTGTIAVLAVKAR